MTRKTIAEHLDSLVTWTGFDPMEEPQRVCMRWLPVVAIIIWFGGVAANLAFTSIELTTVTEPELFLLGMIMWPLGMGLAFICQMIGPVKTSDDTTIDEYDQLMIDQSFNWTNSVIFFFGIVAFLGTSGWVMTVEPDYRLISWVLLFCGGSLVVFRTALPTLWVSWRTKPVEEDD